MAVIGAGFGRTGTLSLKHALEQLGFGPTYHMQEVVRRPSHIEAWHRYAVTGEADWDHLFAGFGSGVDFPLSCAWRPLAAHFPDAKVVLSVRDPQRWWESTATTIYTTRDMFPRWVRTVLPVTDRFLDMSERLVWDGLFGGRFCERDHAIAVFERHVEEVRATLPPERLLVFDVAEGWGPLCRFLGVAEPGRPFPRLNDAAWMRRRIQGARVGLRVLPLAAAGLVALAAQRRSRR